VPGTASPSEGISQDPRIQLVAGDLNDAATVIDLLLRKAAQEREVIDRVKALLIGGMEFERSKTHTFCYEEEVEGNVVQLGLLADFSRTDKSEPVRRIQGLNSFLDLCLVGAAEDLGGHVEEIRIVWLDADNTETCDIAIPDQVGFLLLKAEVCRYRETSKDPYDIYYYCRYSEEPDTISWPAEDSCVAGHRRHRRNAPS